MFLIYFNLICFFIDMFCILICPLASSDVHVLFHMFRRDIKVIFFVIVKNGQFSCLLYPTEQGPATGEALAQLILSGEAPESIQRLDPARIIK